ncbi:hypothetical protein NA57DRAFT_64799 [Rhizodiscina lignyota]|uniref:SMP-30/Gluconolactonase/LRE-like region domain-containing protein n=1 Tax=Rhizodiscina lignyota TaxID=1504668 RepID=A0A9P4ME50_9PEZI|nr:hypothetical protein NA57DRAFT_64799 [Rhizodiscina lignyota]
MRAILHLAGLPLALGRFLKPLPSGFEHTPGSWAWMSYDEPDFRVLPGHFNRSVLYAPWNATVSDPTLNKVNDHLNYTDFVAYDPQFFDIIGPEATIEHLHLLPYQTHEASCWNPESKELFFAEWGPPGGNNGTHTWQYLMNTETNELRNITTDPPTVNAHGCTFYKGKMYVVTDGDHHESGQIVEIDPKTLKKTVLLNNVFEQPFIGFNDIDIDEDGNFWVTDSRSGINRAIIPWWPRTRPGLYVVNATTWRPKPVWYTNDFAVSSANGIAVTATVNAAVDPTYIYSNFALMAYDIDLEGTILTNPRLLNNPIAYYYDGLRVSRNGWIFGGAGQSVDIIHPVTGLTLGSIRVGGGLNVAVNVAFGKHEMWIVGKGGVWHVKGIKERLDRTW